MTSAPRQGCPDATSFATTAAGTRIAWRYLERALEAAAPSGAAVWRTDTSPPSANGGTSSIRSPLQKRPASWYDPGRFCSGDRIELVPPFALGGEVPVRYAASSAGAAPSSARLK